MTTEPLRIEMDETGPHAGCCTLWLDAGDSPMIVLDRPLVERLEDALDAVPREATGLVLASASDRVFVAGADLKTIHGAGDTELLAYLAYASEVYAMFSQVQIPTAAAIGGAALGGGLELAMHCDGLIGGPSPSGKPYPVGLPEAGLCLCPGWGGTNMLPARIDPRDAIERTASGRTMTYPEAVEAGLFDATSSTNEDLVSTAKSWVLQADVPERDGAPSRWIGRPDRAPGIGDVLHALEGEAFETPSAQAVLSAIRAGLSDDWAAAVRVEQENLVRLRSTPEGRAAIESFFAKSARR